jgi:hypothetical protein
MACNENQSPLKNVNQNLRAQNQLIRKRMGGGGLKHMEYKKHRKL